jgi:hypothetical protein
MRKVEEGCLWIGNASDARNFAQLYESSVQAVVDLALEERLEPPPRDLIYLRHPLRDGGGDSPAQLRTAVASVGRLLIEGIPALVACGAGMSRSPSVAVVAIAMHRQERAEDRLQRVVAHGPRDVSPLFWQEIIAACFADEVRAKHSQRPEEAPGGAGAASWS